VQKQKATEWTKHHTNVLESFPPIELTQVTLGQTGEWAGIVERTCKIHENGCLWNGWAFECAPGGGYLDVLKYLYENGCPFFFLEATVRQKDDLCLSVRFHRFTSQDVKCLWSGPTKCNAKAVEIIT
jgi:hypothetical protein